MLNIRICPTCGSKRIRPVRRGVTRIVGGKKYLVPAVEFHECSGCGEKLYGCEGMRKLESYRLSRARPTVGERVGHLVGKLKGGPHDLSTNKKHLKGFGAS